MGDCSSLARALIVPNRPTGASAIAATLERFGAGALRFALDHHTHVAPSCIAPKGIAKPHRRSPA